MLSLVWTQKAKPTAPPPRKDLVVLLPRFLVAFVISKRTQSQNGQTSAVCTKNVIWRSKTRILLPREKKVTKQTQFLQPGLASFCVVRVCCGSRRVPMRTKKDTSNPSSSPTSKLASARICAICGSNMKNARSNPSFTQKPHWDAASAVFNSAPTPSSPLRRPFFPPSWPWLASLPCCRVALLPPFPLSAFPISAFTRLAPK